jgi:hypothetical protein
MIMIMVNLEWDGYSGLILNILLIYLRFSRHLTFIIWYRGYDIAR